MLANSSAMVLPSRSEGLPTVVLEAMASGLPVVVTNTSNLGGVEEHGAGFMCDPTLDSLQVALERLLLTPTDTLESMGWRGRAWVESDYTWRSAAQKILEATESLMN